MSGDAAALFAFSTGGSVTDSDDRNVAEELAAIKAVAEALQTLSTASQRHVIAYVLDLLGIAETATQLPPPPQSQPAEGSTAPAAPATPQASQKSVSITDIRSLREQKQPRSAAEMAALVAYYVSELLPENERRSVINKDDIEKYFKQAPFPVPARLSQTLPDAARAGYFDAVERGQYKLNPVGYNLVVHGMPSSGNDSSPRSSRPRRAVTKKRAPSKKAAPAKKVAASSKTPTGARKGAGSKRS
jgi:hypothetical protein